MIVFVHGFFGWGESDALWRRVPYFGLASGSIPDRLRAQGYDCAAASVGPLSSAWDRACELYAQLTGTRTDYGEAHSAKYGHDRFGPVYEKPIIPQWDINHPIDLIGHSFGGTTIRLLAHLLEYGAPEEQETDACTELFKGNGGGLVRSVTCVATPHNGTTLLSSAGESSARFVNILTSAAEYLGIPKGEYLSRLNEPLPEEDSGMHDLSPDGAAVLNRFIRDVPGVRYISLPCRRTHQGLTFAHLPDITMSVPLRPSAYVMGRDTGYTTPGGIYIDSRWSANDGLVNTFSETRPLSPTDCENAPDGVWKVLPATDDDHFEIIGGLGPGNRERVISIYTELVNIINQVPETGNGG